MRTAAGVLREDGADKPQKGQVRLVRFPLGKTLLYDCFVHGLIDRWLISQNNLLAYVDCVGCLLFRGKPRAADTPAERRT
jgi:hypothetical protein